MQIVKMRRRRVAQDQDRAVNAVFAQVHALIDAADREEIDAAALQLPRAFHIPMAIGIRLDDAHDLAGCRDELTDLLDIVLDLGQIDLGPGAALTVQHGHHPQLCAAAQDPPDHRSIAERGCRSPSSWKDNGRSR